MLAGTGAVPAGGATSTNSNALPPSDPIGFEPPVQKDSLSLPKLPGPIKVPTYEYGFPVVNVRYTYPPTAVDGRRRLGLAQRQAQILDNSAVLEARIMKDFSDLMKHIGLQERIAGLLISIPWSSRNRVQETLLGQLAKDIPEIPASSFLEENPQINIAVEDNGADFVGVSSESMRPDQALNRLQEIQKSQSRNRAKFLDILKLNLKIYDLLVQYLRIPMTTAAASSFIQQTPPVQSPMYPPLLATPIPGWYSDKKNSTNQSSPGAPAQGGDKIGIDLPFYMKLRARVMQGGAQGAKALAALIDLWNDQEGARDSIRRSMVGMDCKMLMMLPKTPDYVKNLAGTLLTLMTGIPTGSSVPDFKSGGYGHVNIVVPRPSRVYAADKEIALAEET